MKKSAELQENLIRRIGLITFVFLMVLLMIGLRLYIDVDNYQLAMVTSGILGENNYCRYISWLLCVGIAGLNQLSQQVDWFSFICRALTIVSIFSLGAVVNKAKGKWSWIVGYIVIFSVAFPYIMSQNYTLVTAFVIGTGIILLMLSLWGYVNGPIWNVSGTVLIFAALLLRMNGAILFFSFMILEILQYCYRNFGKAKIVNLMKKIVPVLLCFIIIVASDMLVQSSEKYSASMRYDLARISILDFPVKPYSDISDQVPQLSENDYNMILGWNLLDTELINSELMEQIAENGARKIPLQQAFETIKQQFLAVGGLSALTSVLMLWAFLNAQWDGKLKILCSIGGAGIIAMYFAIKGRFIDRVAIPLLLCLIVMATLTILLSKGHEMRSSFFVGVLCVLFIIRLTDLPIDTWDIQLAINAKQGVETGTMEETNQDVFFQPTWMYYSAEGRMIQGKLPTKEFLKHNMSMGDWSYGQVYFYEHLLEMGIENPMRDLIERPDTYVVDQNVDQILTYLREHYDQNVQAITVGEKNGLPVWKFESVVQ